MNSTHRERQRQVLRKASMLSWATAVALSVPTKVMVWLPSSGKIWT